MKNEYFEHRNGLYSSKYLFFQNLGLTSTLPINAHPTKKFRRFLLPRKSYFDIRIKNQNTSVKTITHLKRTTTCGKISQWYGYFSPRLSLVRLSRMSISFFLFGEKSEVCSLGTLLVFMVKFQAIKKKTEIDFKIFSTDPT